MRYTVTFVAFLIAYLIFEALVDVLRWNKSMNTYAFISAIAVGWLTYTTFGNFWSGVRGILKRAIHSAQSIKDQGVLSSTVLGARKIKDKFSSAVNSDTSAAFFAQAEQEVNDKTYEKGLWSQALVKAKGDESKRKITYMELRVAQLQRKSRELL